MRAKTEKYEGVFYTNKTKRGCIMQKEMYTLVYFVQVLSEKDKCFLLKF